MLPWFDLSSFNVPTMLYYQPKHNRFSDILGAFSYDNIWEQENKVTTGGARTREAAVQSSKMQLSKECFV